MLDRMLFYLKAKNRHGVHSPFVYAFLTRGLYVKQNVKGSRALKLLLRVCKYFKVRSLCSSDLPEGYRKQLSSYFPDLGFKDHPADLYYFSAPGEALDKSLDNSRHRQNDTIYFVDGLRLNKSSELHWNQVCSRNDISVSMDFYDAGLLFFRREQQKEHFKIRL